MSYSTADFLDALESFQLGTPADPIDSKTIRRVFADAEIRLSLFIGQLLDK